jgi:hypothetical protein
MFEGKFVIVLIPSSRRFFGRLLLRKALWSIRCTKLCLVGSSFRLLVTTLCFLPRYNKMKVRLEAQEIDYIHYSRLSAQEQQRKNLPCS